MALSRIDTTNMIEDVPQSKIDNNINFRNIIINGDMSQSQRSTSATGLGNGDSGYHTVDRWKFVESGSPTFEFTQSQSTDVPTGQGFVTSLKMDCTTADASLATDDLLRIMQVFEGQNLQYLKKGTSSAESLTASFWVKSSKTGTYICELEDVDNNRTINKSYTINSADTWEKKTITYDGDTTGAFDNDNAESLTVYFWLVAGSTFNASGNLATSWASIGNSARASDQVNLSDSTSNEWYVTGVQLEAGTSASDFEFLPFDVNLRRCQRYFEKLIDVANNINQFFIGSSYSSTRNFLTIFMRQVKRAEPTIASSNVGGNIYQDSGAHSVSALANIYTDTSNVKLDFTASVTAGDAFHYDAGSSQIVTADAEL
jgi:hypothetical protein